MATQGLIAVGRVGGDAVLAERSRAPRKQLGAAAGGRGDRPPQSFQELFRTHMRETGRALEFLAMSFPRPAGPSAEAAIRGLYVVTRTTDIVIYESALPPEEQATVIAEQLCALLSTATPTGPEHLARLFSETAIGSEAVHRILGSVDETADGGS